MAKYYLNNAIKAYEHFEMLLSITQVAYVYSVSKAILYYRINAHYHQILYKISKQRLISKEKESINN